MEQRRQHRRVHRPAAQRVDRADGSRQPEDRAHHGRDVEVHLGQHPGGRALVDVQRCHRVRQRGRDLHTRGAGPDHRDALAGDVVGVVPGVGPQHISAEVREPVDVDLGFGVDVTADRTDDEPGGDLRTVAEFQTPQRLRVVPHLPGDLATRAQVWVEPELAGGVAQIPVDLGPRRKEAGPLDVRGEGELVPQRRDVDGQTGIVVVAPRPAEVVAALEDHEICDAPSPQQMPARDTAGPASDDGDVEVGVSHVNKLANLFTIVGHIDETPPGHAGSHAQRRAHRTDRQCPAGQGPDVAATRRRNRAARCLDHRRAAGPASDSARAGGGACRAPRSGRRRGPGAGVGADAWWTAVGGSDRSDDLPLLRGAPGLRWRHQGADPRRVRGRHHERDQLQHRHRQEPHPAGDRVVVTLDGKFLAYDWTSAPH